MLEAFSDFGKYSFFKVTLLPYGSEHAKIGEKSEFQINFQKFGCFCEAEQLYNLSKHNPFF